MIEINCSKCKKEVRKKYMKRINGKYICKDCNKKNRERRREETINQSGIKKELKELDKKVKKEYSERYRNKRRKTIEEIPKIKGSNLYKKKEKSSSYILFEERQILFGMLVRRGMSGEEAKERIKNIREEQKKIRDSMKQKNKSEDEIKIKQQKLLEELWNY